MNIPNLRPLIHINHVLYQLLRYFGLVQLSDIHMPLSQASIIGTAPPSAASHKTETPATRQKPSKTLADYQL